MSLFRRTGPPAEVLQQIQSWTRATLQLSPDDRVVVHEIRCDDPACPPHGTVIAIFPLSGTSRKVTIPLPAAAVLQRRLVQELKKSD